MKNSILILAILLLAFVSCKKEESQNVKTDNQGVQIKDGMLSFNNSTSFVSVVEDLKSTPYLKPETKLMSLLGKNSYLAIKKTSFLKSSTGDSSIVVSDTLITDPTFASLLNDKREIEVENTVYRITPYGTFMFMPQLKSKVDSIILILEAGGQINETQKETYLFEVLSGIYRYDTFKEMEEQTVEVGSPDTIPASTLKSAVTEDIEVHTIANKHTIVGKFLQNTFGFSASFERNFESKRRVKLKFQSPNFILFSYITIKIEMQKKNWIGWSGTECQQLKLGWDGISYKFKNPVTIPNSFATKKSDPTTWRTGQIQPPASNKTYFTVEISDYSFSLTDKEVAKGFKAGFDWVRSKLSPTVKKDDIAVITNPNDVYVSSESFTSDNSESISKTLDWSVGLFVFKWNMNSSVGVSNFNVKPMGFTIQNASIFGMAKYNDKWLGIRIEKN